LCDYFDLVSYVEEFFSLYFFGDFDVFLVEESFYTFDGYEDTVVVE